MVLIHEKRNSVGETSEEKKRERERSDRMEGEKGKGVTIER